MCKSNPKITRRNLLLCCHHKFNDLKNNYRCKMKRQTFLQLFMKLTTRAITSIMEPP